MLEMLSHATQSVSELAPLGFSLVEWFNDGWYELKNYFSHMGKHQWMIVSACTVTFGFMCLRGYSIKG